MASSQRETVSDEILRTGLNQIADSEWRKNKSYLDFVRDTESERRDYQMLNIWRVTKGSELAVPGLIDANGLTWFARTADSLKDVKIPGFDLLLVAPGGVEIRVER